MKKGDIVLPVYYRIAMDIASRIAAQQYSVGEKVYARSSIAGHYGVSSETARRAIHILADLEIVKTEKGSGVMIISIENAVAFVQQFQDSDTLLSMKNELFAAFSRQQQELSTLERRFRQFVDNTERFRSTNPFVPFTITIEADMNHLNESSAKVNFWHNTTATIIAIKRGNEVITSPGPYATFETGDIVYFIGDENAYEKVRRFMQTKDSD